MILESLIRTTERFFLFKSIFQREAQVYNCIMCYVFLYNAVTSIIRKYSRLSIIELNDAFSSMCK